ncbi:hypothetical protein SRS16CHR_05529 [Variovorax sp. SRS16]|nr:hypothetical protein SRS16CHR_05529 [Variovorax sp. SRS16]
MPLPIPVAPPGIFDPAPVPRPAAARDEATVITGVLSRPSPASGSMPLASSPRIGRASASAKSRGASAPGKSASGAPWRLIGVIAALVVVGGGWYVYDTGTNDQAPADAPVALSAPPPVEPPVAPVAPSVEAQIVAPSPPKAEEPAPPPPAPAAVAKPRIAAVPKPRKPVPVPAAAPAPAVVAAPPPPEAVAPPPAAPPNPQTACADLSFFARARCMAAQCAKADFKASPQCDAVRRQQQIDEEKRNPTLAD